MRVVVGIDLGSTTCKAVALDEGGRVVGKGITNTRANYGMATRIATHAALTNARLAQLGRSAGLEPEEIARCEALYYRADYVHKHRLLVERLLDHAERMGHPEWRAPVETMAAEVTARLEDESTLGAIVDRSLFFKDLAYAAYLEAAERLPEAGLERETFLGLLDKGLAWVENEVYPLDPVDVLAAELPPERRRLAEVLRGTEIEVAMQVGTGYGRQLLPFPEEQIQSEILCHARGAHHLFPGTHTVLDIGGQDTKAIQLDDEGVVRSFFMNDRCAAGCGRYLGYIAEELAIGLGELGPTACRACRHVPISSTCTVFAGAELRSLLDAGERPEEILLGLHRAIVLRAMSLLARSGGVFDELTFTGGVAKNEAVRRVLRELVDANYDGIRINVHPDSIYMGALGAALYARERA